MIFYQHNIFLIFLKLWSGTFTAQKMKFSIKDFFSKCDQIRSFLRVRLHLLKKSWMENSFFCAVIAMKWLVFLFEDSSVPL